jgi:hypothetical protein
MAKGKTANPGSSGTVEVNVGGQFWSGTYRESDGIVQVECDYGSKTAFLQSLPAEPLSRMLLREIIQEEVRQKPLERDKGAS